ncbi:hypothetical protein KFL_002570040 [Klebsormidium nitens]|uniref:Uncharacterized protein n=1 Tax=Klebsormidium nitens TaxID=105231 RepID=A0A1Y1IAX1_KLENI|nr:hypothetical protein KFL_002570040 [Klebsormidium nitens]|eukprot:GAQ85836.1 hypothetical protein KFL_002570040 [Klebsormidium nitens]
MAVLVSRLASGSFQSVPVKRGLAAALAILSGSAAAYLWTTRTSGLASQGVVDSFVNVEQQQQPEEVAHDCDCAPLWNCIQEGRGDCDVLERGLRSCLARQKT